MNGSRNDMPAPTLVANWRNRSILVLLSLGAAIDFVGRTIIASVLATKDFRQHFTLSDIDRGTLSSAFFWVYAALQIPLGWVVDRRDIKWPYTILFTLWCWASAGTGLMNSFTGLLIMWVLRAPAKQSSYLPRSVGLDSIAPKKITAPSLASICSAPKLARPSAHRWPPGSWFSMIGA